MLDVRIVDGNGLVGMNMPFCENVTLAQKVYLTHKLAPKLAP